jgi:hypothetical protein
MRLLFLSLILSTSLLGCATEEAQGPRVYVHPAAYGADGFYMDYPTPPHEREPVPGAFYFRSCTRATEGSYFSKTAFSCADR